MWLPTLALVQPAVAGLLFLSDRRLTVATLRSFVGLCLLLSVFTLQAQQVPGYVAAVRVNTAEELGGILARIEALRLRNSLSADMPVMFVLHGEEARSFIKSSYGVNQSLVDESARLSELGFVEIEVCETWLGNNGLDAKDLQPFVKPIVYGPARIDELIRRQKYTYF